jgi:hypothetical protein
MSTGYIVQNNASHIIYMGSLVRFVFCSATHLHLFTLKIMLRVKWYTTSDDTHVHLPQSFKIRTEFALNLSAHRAKMYTVRIQLVSYPFPLVSEHCTLVDNVHGGRGEEKKGKCDNKDNQLLIGHASKAHAQ